MIFNQMKWRIIPYILLFVFALVTSIVRLFLLPELHFAKQIEVFLVQVAVFFLSWAIIRQIGVVFERKLPGNNQVIKRSFLQIVVSVLVVIPIAILLDLYVKGLNLPIFTKAFFVAITIAYLFFVVLLNLSYSAFYFFRNWESSILEKTQLEVQAAKLGKDKSLMQYHNLKNQVNPHFLFNTFTSLDGLIQTDPELASEFVRHLSKVYRYVLQNKENEVVTLQTEIDFIGHYISLLQIRYKDILQIGINVSDTAMERGIVMVTLQMLIDNAIKHNSLQVSSPLKIEIWDKGNCLHVKNNKQLRKQIETSNKQGLNQLKELYSFLSKDQLTIIETEEIFEIQLPLL